MNIYLCGPISALPIDEARQRFAQAEADLRAQFPHATITNPMTLPHQHADEWAAYMREDIAALMQCQAIALLPGWEDSKGCQLEISIGLKLDFVIYALFPKIGFIEVPVSQLRQQFIKASVKQIVGRISHQKHSNDGC
jgi:hypothetical protein